MRLLCSQRQTTSGFGRLIKMYINEIKDVRKIKGGSK